MALPGWSANSGARHQIHASPVMEQKFSMVSSVAAFLVAWLSGLAAGVSPDAILVRSAIGAAVFYFFALALCRISGALLSSRDEGPESAAGSARTDNNQNNVTEIVE